MKETLNISKNKAISYCVSIMETTKELIDSMNDLGSIQNRYLIENCSKDFRDRNKDIFSSFHEDHIMDLMNTDEDILFSELLSILKNKDFPKDENIFLMGDISLRNVMKRVLDFIDFKISLVFIPISLSFQIEYVTYFNRNKVWYPAQILLCTSFISKCDYAAFHDDFALVMQLAIMRDANFYEWLISNRFELEERNPEILFQLLLKCTQIHKKIVEKATEKERNSLNLGVEIANALEGYNGADIPLTYGNRLSLGCICMAFLSNQKEMLSIEECYEIRDMLFYFDYPISISNISMKELSDKLFVSSEYLSTIILSKIGKIVSEENISREMMEEALSKIYFNDLEND